MLGRGGKHTNLAGKLLLSSALVAVSLAYGFWQKGFWQRHDAAGPKLAAPMPAPMNAPHASAKVAPPASQAIPEAAPEANAHAAARLAQKDAALPLTALASLSMYAPPPSQAPLPLVTGTPDPGAAAPIPAGTHLQDGEYLSDVEVYEWGDLQVKITVQGGAIRGAQLVKYPDHRAESLEISRRASPLLNSEVIKTQQAKVDIVSSATDTSYVYRDAIASVLTKAAR